jgi:type II secretory pathway pseudopilin PulG
MDHRKGFTRIDLLILVAAAGVAAAVALPALMRARVAANESATLGDIRTLISAQAAYASANQGFYDSKLTCLTVPSAAPCIPSYTSSMPTFLDSALASQSAKAGYNRVFSSGLIIGTNPRASPTSTFVYSYDATPVVVGVTGVRGFAGDYSRRVCFTPNGTPVGTFGGQLPANCRELR